MRGIGHRDDFKFEPEWDHDYYGGDGLQSLLGWNTHHGDEVSRLTGAPTVYSRVNSGTALILLISLVSLASV